MVGDPAKKQGRRPQRILATSFDSSPFRPRIAQNFLLNQSKTMIAIGQFGGHQALVSTGDVLDIDRQSAAIGAEVNFPVLLQSETDGQALKLGTPLVEGVLITAKVIEHGRGEKIRVFKMKPRKRYRRLQGHRQDFSRIEITSVGETKAKTTAKKETPKPVAKSSSTKSTTAKKAAPAKATPKKTTAKKAPTAKTKTAPKTTKKTAPKK